MINGQMVLAVIPARGGSKRCPRKNIRVFRGLPLVEWAWKAARESDYIDRVVLSTDDAEIREYARACDVEVLHRPAKLATDDALNEDVLRNALAVLAYDWVVLLQPTSPLRTAEDIDRALELAQTCHPVISVREDGTKNGAIYIARDEWLSASNNFDKPFTPYRMPDERSLDIDYPAQFEEVRHSLVNQAA